MGNCLCRSKHKRMSKTKGAAKYPQAKGSPVESPFSEIDAKSQTQNPSRSNVKESMRNRQENECQVHKGAMNDSISAYKVRADVTYGKCENEGNGLRKEAKDESGNRRSTSSAEISSDNDFSSQLRKLDEQGRRVMASFDKAVDHRMRKTHEVAMVKAYSHFNNAISMSIAHPNKARCYIYTKKQLPDVNDNELAMSLQEVYERLQIETTAVNRLKHIKYSTGNDFFAVHIVTAISKRREQLLLSRLKERMGTPCLLMIQRKNEDSELEDLMVDEDNIIITRSISCKLSSVFSKYLRIHGHGYDVQTLLELTLDSLNHESIDADIFTSLSHKVFLQRHDDESKRQLIVKYSI